MLFNSAVFILVFLPITWLGFFTFGVSGRRSLAIIWLTCASFFFYGWWNITYVPLLAGSILVNFAISRVLARHRNQPLLIAGIALNLGLLGYYKYAGFFMQAMDQMSGAAYPIPFIALPLAISFFTFQQIAVLVDSYDGMAETTSFIEYCAFITFFPHLIAGPITHHKEIMPQLEAAKTYRPQWGSVALGLTLFLLGLGKKVILADNIASWVDPVFAGAAHGAPPGLFASWAGAVGYSLQIYFDFSGYTDMAIGIGMMFGIRLPRNFDSPYKARNIIDYWSRWHMTLTRFLTAYIFNPISMALTRARLKAGKPVLRRGKTTPGAFLILLAFPVTTTMFLAGMWHGAGWQFIIFGLLHGFYLVLNHTWRTLKAHRKWPVDSARWLPRAIAIVTTFICTTVALVFFRSDGVHAALTLLGGMAGLHGFMLPFDYSRMPGVWQVAQLLHLPFGPVSLPLGEAVGIPLLMVMVWALPNSQQWLRMFETSLGPQAHGAAFERPGILMRTVLLWRPTMAFGVMVGFIGFFAVMRALSAAPSEFLYFKF